MYGRVAGRKNRAVGGVSGGARWLVIGVAKEQVTFLTELSEEESRIWRQAKQTNSEMCASKFSDILSDVLRKRNDKK